MSECRLKNTRPGAVLERLCGFHRVSLEQIVGALVERLARNSWYQLKIRSDDSIALSNLDRNQLGDWSNAKIFTGRFPDCA